MAEKFRARRLNAAPVAPAVPGAFDFIQTAHADGARAFLTGSNGIPLPLFGQNVNFIPAGGSLPADPLREAIYVDTAGKALYFIDADGNRFAYPLTEGSILANVVHEEALAPVTTTATAFQSALLMNQVFDPGIYLIDCVYGWACDTTRTDIEIQVLIDGVVTGQPHRQEPKDSAGTSAFIATDQAHVGLKRFSADFSGGGSHTVEIQFRSTRAGITSAMFDMSITCWNLTGLG